MKTAKERKQMRVDPVVNRILEDLDSQMDSAPDDTIEVFMRGDFCKKYKLDPKNFNTIRNRVLVKLTTCGYHVRQNSQDQYYISW
jgi:hypothetical protein